jgi:hypothetical protein
VKRVHANPVLDLHVARSPNQFPCHKETGRRRLLGGGCKKKITRWQISLSTRTIAGAVAYIKGTWTRDYNCVKVGWFDRSWLGESPADIHNFFNCPFNIC